MRKFILLYSTVLLIFSGCANQLPPGGGPVDRKSPEVIRTFPENGTINFNKNYVEFEFSEYINKRSLMNSIFISPYLSDEVEQKWSGRKLRLIFPEKLKENQTYVISLGTDITDLRGNKLNETFTLTFSTGSKIDQGIISGRVYDKKPDGIMIYFYLIDTLKQFVDYTQKKPDFICQTSKDGSFILSGLPNGLYRIIAVRDQMKNLIYDINEDEIGLPYKDFELNDTSRIIRNVQFEMIKIDTIKPTLNSVRFIDLNHLLLNFSEPIETSSFNIENCFIYDSLENEKFNPLGFFLNDKNSIMLVTPILKSNKDYIISLKGLKDLSGNELDSIQSTFYSEMISDTIPVTIKSIQGNFSSSSLEFFNPEISINFNDLVYCNNFLEALLISDTAGNKIKFELTRQDSANFKIRLEPRKQKERVLIKINLSFLEDFSGKKLDSIYTKIFETNSEADYGTISGGLKNKKEPDRNLLVEAKSINDNKIYKIETREDKYQIKNILPGNYFVKISIPDTKSNLSYKSFSNPFIYYPDTIKVKSRWPTTDVDFDLEELFR
ncbi:MAG: Ig-like domain-containing protein [Ignavibacteria bacterium]|jgi:hypothetical protein|nr:Ig-like domain-containing protein [Ignavibacteria bacterium]MDH7528775.1 Ig-like domain-containing protein [Ignavibacteria bacterium]